MPSIRKNRRGFTPDPIFPDDAAQIEANLTAFRKEILSLKSEYENKFASLADVTLFALASEFVYMTADMGLFVDGYFLKQDIHWTERDVSEFEEYLRESDIKTVIHKWPPDEKIKQAIVDAGAALVVLDSAESGLKIDRQLVPDGYQQQLASNLELLYQALRAAGETAQ